MIDGPILEEHCFRFKPQRTLNANRVNEQVYNVIPRENSV